MQHSESLNVSSVHCSELALRFVDPTALRIARESCGTQCHLSLRPGTVRHNIKESSPEVGTSLGVLQVAEQSLPALTVLLPHRVELLASRRKNSLSDSGVGIGSLVKVSDLSFVVLVGASTAQLMEYCSQNCVLAKSQDLSPHVAFMLREEEPLHFCLEKKGTASPRLLPCLSPTEAQQYVSQVEAQLELQGGTPASRDPLEVRVEEGECLFVYSFPKLQQGASHA